MALKSHAPSPHGKGRSRAFRQSDDPNSPWQLARRKFAKAFIRTLSLKAATAEAQIAYNTGANWLSSDEKLQQMLTEERDILIKKLDLSVEKVLEEYVKIAFSNSLDYFKVDEGGKLVPNLQNLTRDQAAAIAEVTDQKLKLHDKKGALDSLAKHLGMFIEKHEHSGNITIVRRRFGNTDT